jgi:hypothetical protein
MRYHEIARHRPTERQSLFNIATLFVPRGQADAFIAVCQQHNGRIVQTRHLSQFNGCSVDVLVDCPDSAASLLADWIERSQTISDTVRRGKTALDTLSELIDGEGTR